MPLTTKQSRSDAAYTVVRRSHVTRWLIILDPFGRFDLTKFPGISSCCSSAAAVLPEAYSLLGFPNLSQNSQVATSGVIARTFGGTNDLFTAILDYKVTIVTSG